MEPEVLREARWGPLPIVERTPLQVSPPCHQTHQALVDVAVHLLELVRRVARSEVPSPASQDGIQVPDPLPDVLHPCPASTARQLPDSTSDAVHRLARRPPKQIRPPPKVRTHDPQVATQKVESLFAETQLDNPRLLRV